ncbi:Piwi domain-containing protein [Halteromyces radiatus]|uniref:Piwi domain-containing protein n=1 Tax=Halteromyces radiatus TaxID=101107 RepID=UPI002220AD4D|nr:Piwi domain-containing protein [Halteromyces radiatus]KAI8099254.1 Piwi domain-containing protein [Halteromyces radiatus]
MAQASNRDLTELIMRPNTGTVGKQVRVRSNFFEMTSIPTQNIQHLNIQFLPEGTSLPVRKKLWQCFEDSLKGRAFLNKIKPVFDGRANLFSPKPLKCGDDNLGISFEVNLQQGNRSRGVFKLKIKPVGVINMSELQLLLDGKSIITNNCLMAIRVLDTLFHYFPYIYYTTMGRSFYTPQGKRPLPNGAEVWQGFNQYARPTQGKMMVNIGVSSIAFYQPGPLHKMLPKLLGRHSLGELRRGIPDRERIKVEKILKNLKIVVVHRGAEKRLKYKINKLTPTSAENTVFKDDTGNEVTVAQHFQNTYNRRLAFPFLPCVVVKKNTFLPMEVCEVVSGQCPVETPNDYQKGEMIKFTWNTPNARANLINQGIDILDHKDNPYVQQFGVSVKPDMTMVNARVLPAPKISFHASSEDASFTPVGGTWSLSGKKVANGATLKSWSVVNFASSINDGSVRFFIRELGQMFIDKGLNVINLEPPITHADPQGDVERTLKEAWLKAGNATKVKPELIFCILPNTGVQIYADIKRVCDTVIGIPTQCVKTKYVAKAERTYIANVSLKVNMKLGGVNWVLDYSQLPFISSKPTIVFGADVAHPDTGDTKTPTLVGLTASLDPHASRYASAIRPQVNHTEIIADLANMVKELLKTFYQNCGRKPEQILFYRGDIPETQFNQVFKYEIAAIHAACASLDKTYKPPVTFVVVQKRHHARFFPVEPRDADRSGNCQPGTVVDTDIVHPFEFDFYLQSHAGLQGTSRPAHYHVLYDDNNFSADALQELTYRLCYMCQTTTNALSICAPVYYAGILAERARYYQKGKNWNNVTDNTNQLINNELATFGCIKPELKNTMFFL